MKPMRNRACAIVDTQGAGPRSNDGNADRLAPPIVYAFRRGEAGAAGGWRVPIQPGTGERSEGLLDRWLRSPATLSATAPVAAVGRAHAACRTAAGNANGCPDRHGWAMGPRPRAKAPDGRIGGAHGPAHEVRRLAGCRVRGARGLPPGHPGGDDAGAVDRPTLAAAVRLPAGTPRRRGRVERAGGHGRRYPICSVRRPLRQGRRRRTTARRSATFASAACGEALIFLHAAVRTACAGAKAEALSMPTPVPRTRREAVT